MENLICRAFDVQFQAQGHGVTLAPEAPILYFGDLAAYKASSVRIVTVAINPSSAEFPPENPFERFPDWGSAPNILRDEPTRYLRGLNRYFQAAPYLRWFRHLGPVLEGFDAGFAAGSQNVALHTDFATPVATRPVWGKIRHQAIREALLGPGVALWHALVAELKPHLIVMSCGRTWLDRIRFDAQSGWEAQHTLARGADRIQGAAPNRDRDAIFHQRTNLAIGFYLLPNVQAALRRNHTRESAGYRACSSRPPYPLVKE